MKKILLTITGFVFTLLAMAQSPNLLNYQGVARNAVGNVLPSQPIGLRLSILSGSPTGTVVYQETRNVTTNAFGLFNVQVGSPGAITTTGTIAGINWTAFGAGSGTKYLQVEIDAVGGTSYFNVGSTQLVSVPYALNAGSAAPVGPAGGDLSGTYPNPTVARIQGRPVAATAPVNLNLLMWDAVTASWIPATAAQAGVVSGTGTLNTVAKWTPNGTTIGNSQIFDNGTSVGVGTITPVNKFEVLTAGTTSAGSFTNTNAANTAPALTATTNSAADAVQGINTGTGRGGYFQVNNAASTADGVRGETNGTGASWGVRGISSGTNGAGLFQQTNVTNTSNNLQSNQAGLGRAGLFNASNAASTANAVEINVAGAGAGLVSNSTGTGASGIFNNTNTANTANTVLVDNANLTAVGYGNSSIYGRRGATGLNTFLYTGVPTGIIGSSSTGIGVQGTSEAFFGVAGLTYNGSGVQAVSLNTGTALYAQAFGTGLTANFVNTNAANISNTARIDNANLTAVGYGNNALYVRRGATLANTFLFVNIPTAMTGSSSTGIGVQGTSATGQGVSGLAHTGIGVVAASITTGTALVAQAFGTGYAMQTAGRVQITGQGAALNRILTSNAVGDATWNTLATVGGVSGTGTLNYIPKWTPDGATIGNSQLFDDGTNVGIGTNTPAQTLHVAKAVFGGMGGQLMLENNDAPNANNENSIDFVPIGWAFSSNIPGARILADDDGAFSSTLIFSSKIPGASANALAERMRISSGGNVGINNNNPNFNLDVAGTTIPVNSVTTGPTNSDHAYQGVGVGGIGWVGNNFSGLWANGTAPGAYGVYATPGLNGIGVMGIQNGPGGYGVLCQGNGGYTGTWTLVSDAKFKQDFVSIDNALDKIKLLNPTTYLLKKDDYKLMNFPAERQFGFVAQELEKVFPTLVEAGKIPGTSPEATMEYKSVNYIGMIPVLTKAIQEQQKQIEDLKKMVQDLIKQK